MATRRRSSRRTEAKWILASLLFFVLLLATAWERVAIREASGEIEKLERQLSTLTADQALLQVRLQQACRFTDVKSIAKNRWSMSVADPGQCILLASDEEWIPLKTAALAPARYTSGAGRRIARLFGDGVAREAGARSSNPGEGEHAARPR